MSTKNDFSKFCSARTASFTHLTQSVKKWGLSACTMTTSKKSLQSFPTMCVIPLLLHGGEDEKKQKKKKKNIATQQFVSWVRADRKIWATDNQHLHKAKGAVGDEKEFLAMTDQPIQNSLSVFAAQNELVCTRGDKILFTVQQCADRIQRGEQCLTKIFHDPFIHVSFNMDHANCFLRITYVY